MPQAASELAVAGSHGRQMRRRPSLPIFASVAALAFVFVLIFAPDQSSSATAAPVSAPQGKAQVFAAEATIPVSTEVRDAYSVTKKVVAPTPPKGAPAFGKPDPGSAQAIGYQLVLARGWGDSEFSCLVALFNRESHWNVYASNPSGAYGIPQALPGSKMASAGADWATNPATQITWGLNYIAGRYSTPCGAWSHSQTTGWY
jgi:hypothetical protein